MRITERRRFARRDAVGGARMLAANLVVSPLANLHAARAAAWPAGSPAATAARDRRAESAQRRLARAVKV
jgi:hypothetical protein